MCAPFDGQDKSVTGGFMSSYFALCCAGKILQGDGKFWRMNRYPACSLRGSEIAYSKSIFDVYTILVEQLQTLFYLFLPLHMGVYS